MITREQVSEMITKQFGKEVNKEFFLDELFKERTNILFSGTSVDDGFNITPFSKNTYQISFEQQIFGENFRISFYNEQKIDFNLSIKDTNISVNVSQNDIKIRADTENTEFDYTTINEIVEALDLKYNIKSISKYFK